MKVTVTTFGSAGDLFPLLPVASALRERGHEVRWVVPRSLGLYLRSIGDGASVWGDGSEMRFASDRCLTTARLGGWVSWRHVLDVYVRPGLLGDVEVVRGHLRQARPDVLVTSGFAVPGRIASMLEDVGFLECSIYPQHQEIGSRSQFAQRLQSDIAAAYGFSDAVARRLAFGTPADVMLHDPAMVDLGQPTVGYPYWDGVPVSDATIDVVKDWLGSSAQPAFLCTMGSFLGSASKTIWEDMHALTTSLDIRVALVGPGAYPFPTSSSCLAVATFIPLSRIVDGFGAVVHHGGLGTCFAALHAGVPSVVLPQAFDQPYNAALLEGLGVGVNGQHVPLPTAIERVLSNVGIRDAAGLLSTRLVSPETAARKAADLIEQAV